jgi:ubiquinol-cytochrome c reductase subunit 9
MLGLRACWLLCVDLEVVSTQFANTFYNNVVRRNSVYVSSIFAGAFAFGIGFDLGVSSFWDKWNKGVSEIPPPDGRHLISRIVSPETMEGYTGQIR